MNNRSGCIAVLLHQCNPENVHNPGAVSLPANVPSLFILWSNPGQRPRLVATQVSWAILREKYRKCSICICGIVGLLVAKSRHAQEGTGQGRLVI